VSVVAASSESAALLSAPSNLFLRCASPRSVRLSLVLAAVSQEAREGELGYVSRSDSTALAYLLFHLYLEGSC
jgi:hypothetical protein